MEFLYRQKSKITLQIVKYIAIAFFVVSILTLFSKVSVVSAVSGCGPGARDPYIAPLSCRANPDEQTVDSACQANRFLDVTADCCVVICKSELANSASYASDYRTLFSFFGRSVVFTSGDQLAVIVNLGITSFLGVIGAYALLRGVYVGAIVLARTTNEDEIKASFKEMGTLLAGAAIAFGFVIILQLITSALGLGNLSSLQLVDGGGTTIVIE